MLNSLYSDILLEAAGSLPQARRLENPTVSARKSSRVCGSELIIDLKIDDGKIADFGLDAKACALGQASAGLVATNLIGASVVDLPRLYETVRAMLKNNGPAPNGARWGALAALEAIKDYPQRHASTLLIFDALSTCAEEWLNKPNCS